MLVVYFGKEIFKQIKFGDVITKYSVSTFGRVRNDISGRILKPSYTHDGYLMVRLSINGKMPAKTCRVHRLVAEAFIPNPDNKPTVNHKDGCKPNVGVDNLEWATHSEQITHAYRTGLHSRKCPTIKITDAELEDVIRHIKSGMSNEAISSITFVPHYTICQIRNNHTNLIKFETVHKYVKTSKFSDKLLHEICRCIENGDRNVDIYSKLVHTFPDVSLRLIEHLKSGNRYKRITSQYSFYKSNMK